MAKNETRNALTLSFTTVLVYDEKTKTFTAFFTQFPDIIAEGDNEDDALTNLVNAVQDVMAYKLKETGANKIPGSKIREVNFTKDNNHFQASL